MLLSLLLSAALSAPPTGPSSVALLDTAIARMGGDSALAHLTRVRFELLTQWQRTSFDGAPYTDGPSYETHSDVRDYITGTWRNTRRFPVGGTWREITDVVRPDVAIRRIGTGAWAPLNVAYVDERRELFTFAPERALIAARRAADHRARPDTIIGGAAYARVDATLDRYPATLFLRRRDGLLAMARFRAEQPNDFGLAGWGPMEVELWYSRWQKLPNGIAYPTQWDVRRVGKPYKRVTVLQATFDAAVAPADSFAVSDSLRTAFLATATKAMYDLPLDSARLIEPRLATFAANGAPSGAVRLGTRWVLLEPGVAPLSVERASAWLATKTPDAPDVAAAIVATASPLVGGTRWLAAKHIAMHVAPGAAPFVATALAGAPAALTAVARGTWLRVAGDSLWAEPIDLPDAPGTVLVYVPSLQWAYCGPAAAPLQLDYVRARIRDRGWTVTRIGTVRGMATPIPASTAAR